jgi:hypothetical protein
MMIISPLRLQSVVAVITGAGIGAPSHRMLGAGRDRNQRAPEATPTAET